MSSPSTSDRPVPTPPDDDAAGRLTRRRALQVAGAGLAAAGVGAGGVAVARSATSVSRVAVDGPEVRAAERARPTTGGTVGRQLVAAPTTIDLAGTPAATWAFDGAVPAREIRATVGDRLRLDLTNRLPDPTTIHWHGLALRNDMDGVPGLTMRAVAPAAAFRYDFVAPHPGTYWFHPHVGIQLDTGLMGPLVIEDPDEPRDYDLDVVLLLDDWTDGVGASPEANLRDLAENGMGGMAGMGGMDMSGSVDAAHPLGTDTGDVDYPLHLVNGRAPGDPFVVTARPGQRIRLRIINAGSDTAYRVALGGHRLTVVASDGFDVEPVEVDTLVLGMGERYDVLVTAGDGAFPIVASPEGKAGPAAFAVLRTGVSATPAPTAEGLTGRMLGYDDLRPTPAAALPARTPDRTLPVVLEMVGGGRRWTINGRTYADRLPLDVQQGERVRLVLQNRSSMFHPMHLHGHTFAVVRDGVPTVRKDTVNVLPMQRLAIDVEADNPGQWLVHCHNAYHGELGMMTVLSYTD